MFSLSKANVLIIAFQLLAQLNAFAQWTALPKLSGPTYAPFTYPHTTYFGAPLPFGDGKILYAITDVGPTPMSGADAYVAISDDNLSTVQIKLYSSGSLNCCSLADIKAYNDSTFSYFFVDQNSYYENLYTSNRFNTSINPFSSAPFPFYFAFAHTQTSNFRYMLSYFDSVRVARVANTSTLVNQFYLRDYASVNYDLQFINDSTGFVLLSAKANTSKLALLRTKDFGANWSPVMTDSTDAIVDYQTFPSGNIYVLKASGKVFKSTNSGATFSALTAAPSGTYSCIHMANSNTGFIGGAGGVLLKTKDDCQSWTNEVSNTSSKINSIYTFNYSSYFVTDSARVYRSGQPLGIANNTIHNPLSIFPNPANKQITVNYSSPTAQEISVEIIDITGKEMMREKLTTSAQLDVSNLSAGIYLVKVSEEQQQLAIKKLVITH